MQFRYLFLLTALMTILLYNSTVFADSVTTYSDPSLSTVSTYFINGATVYVAVLDSDEQGSSRPATIIPDSGASINITIYDDGTRNDVTANNGVYTGNFTIGTAESSNTTFNLQLENGENATITSSGLVSTVNGTLRADYTDPSVTIVTPSVGNYGPTVDINVNVTETNSGIKFSKYWLDLLDEANTSKTELSCSTITGTEVKNCTVSYDSSSMTAGVYTIWVNTSDNAGNVDLSSVTDVVINNTVITLYVSYTTQSTKKDWFLNTSDNFNVFGNVTDANGNAVTSTVAATLTLSGASIGNSSQSVYTNEQYSFDFDFIGATPGVGTLSLTATDDTGNSVTTTKNVYISRDLAKLYVTIVSEQTYYDRLDNPTIRITAKDSSENAVYNASVTISIPYGSGSSDLSTSGITDTSGVYNYEFNIPDDDTQSTYPITVSGYSQIANSTTVTNSSTKTLSVKWQNIYLSWNDTDPHANESLLITGHLDTSFGNQTIVVSKSGIVKYFIYLNNNESNVYKSWTSLSTDHNANFSFVMKPPHKRTYWIRVNSTIVWYDSVGTSFTMYSTAVKRLTIGSVVVTRNVTEVTKNLTITSYPSSVEIEQGKTKEIEITLKNSGNGTLTDFELNLSGVDWSDWYSLGTLPNNLSEDGESTIKLNITVPDDATVDDYSIKITTTANSTITDNVTFTLKVTPTESSKKEINKTTSSLENELSKLKRDLDNLLKRVDNENLTIAFAKLTQAENLLNESKTLINNGNYFVASQKQDEIKALISEIETIISEQQKLYPIGISKGRIVIIVIIIIMGALGALIYYMWLPEGEGYKPKEGFIFKPKETKLDKIKDKIKDIFKKGET